MRIGYVTGIHVMYVYCCTYVPTSCVMRAYNIARHKTKPRTCVPNLPGRAKIPLNNNVIDILYCTSNSSWREQGIHVEYVCWCTYQLRTYNVRTIMHTRPRPKPRAYVPNLAGRVRIPLNYNVIDFTLWIRPDKRTGVYTYCVPTSVRTYDACTIVPDTDSSKELMCPTYLDV